MVLQFDIIQLQWSKLYKPEIKFLANYAGNNPAEMRRASDLAMWQNGCDAEAIIVAVICQKCLVKLTSSSISRVMTEDNVKWKTWKIFLFCLDFCLENEQLKGCLDGESESVDWTNKHEDC